MLGKNNKTVGEGRIFRNEVRLDMAKAVRMARVDFSVQIVYNHRPQPCEVFAGDIVEAHPAASRASLKPHRTPVLERADVVVASAYPLNSQATKALAWISRLARDGRLPLQHPLTHGEHNDG